MSLQLGEIMDAIAQALIDNVIKRVYAWPIEAPSVPCMIVGYPEDDITFDATMGRGSDHMEFPVYYVAGKVTDRNTRDEISRIIDGTQSVKNALAGTLGDVVNSSEVLRCRIVPLSIAEVNYLAVRFDTEIYS